VADPSINVKQTVSAKMTQRTLLLGRVKMAQAIQMSESDWAKTLSEVEKDPLFMDMLGAMSGGQRIIKFKRFGRTELSGQFYEMQDANVVGGSDVSAERLIEQKKHLLNQIRKIGQENFEKYFLFREDGSTPENISKICDISLKQVRELQDFVLDMSVQAEFYHPSSIQEHNIPRPTLIGKIIENSDGTYSISFFSPHLARGLYEINHTALKRWQKDKHLDRSQASKLRRYIGLLELSNLKQGAFWRVIDFLLRVQIPYYKTRDERKLAAVSLREVARQLEFAPSTISRVIHAKSVLLPWDHEVSLAYLMPGQRKVVLQILDGYLDHQKGKATDAQLAKKIEDEYGIKVSRRTVTACRHIIQTDDTETKEAA